MNPLSLQARGLILSRAKREILLAVIDHADENGKGAAPGVPLLKWETDYSERQVQRLLRELEADGLLIIAAHPYKKPTVYDVDLSAGVTKDAFEPRSSGDISTVTKAAGVTFSGDIAREVAQGVGVTSHGNEPPSGDIASLDLSSNLSLSKDQPISDPQIESRKENARERDYDPTPPHIAAMMGRMSVEGAEAKIQMILSRPVYKAYVRGWDGDNPVLNPRFATETMRDVNTLERAVQDGEITLLEIEETTRWKLSSPNVQSYRIGFVQEHVVLYRKHKRALEQKQPKASDSDGKKYTTGQYAEWIQH